MNVKTKDAELGVIIGRFQVDSLHEGHCELIAEVREKHNRVLILLGSTPGVLVSRNGPLDFHTRMLMIKQAFNDVMILPVYDCQSDKIWSESIDEKINEVLGVGSAVLYGSRDAFIPHYMGNYPVVELDSTHQISGSDIRRQISDDVRNNRMFRRGVIYAAYNRHSVAYPTVDIAIVKYSKGDLSDAQIILGRKPKDPVGLWRFPGGFVDPSKDTSLEAAAQREAIEEVGCEVSVPEYIGSTIVDDWRYRKEQDKIMTSLFYSKYIFGTISGKDDLAGGAKLFDLHSLDENILVPQHIKLIRMLREFLSNRII